MFFKKKNNDNNKIGNLIKVTALLIHAAKIDENYSKHEEEIIKKIILELGASNENIVNIIENGKKIETNSNQILEFTQEIKNMNFVQYFHQKQLMNDLVQEEF